jgi:hypothetical protein
MQKRRGGWNRKSVLRQRRALDPAPQTARTRMRMSEVEQTGVRLHAPPWNENRRATAAALRAAAAATGVVEQRDPVQRQAETQGCRGPKR